MKKLYLSAFALAASSTAAFAQAPQYYPSSYADVIAGAKAEGRVIVYGTPDPYIYEPLVASFQELYPGITVEFNQQSSTPMYSRFISEVAAKSATADIMWSPAMDLQIKLVVDGYAMPYESPEAKKVADWAIWKGELATVTLDPIPFIYNKADLTEDQVPKSHAEVAEKLRTVPAYKDRVVVYDLETSGTGFQLLAVDETKLGEKIFDIHKAIGEIGGRTGSGTTNIIESVGSGENVFAYNLNGAYVGPMAKDNPDIGFLMPKDYTLGLLNTQFIAKAAAHPNAAKLWFDFMLSERGQKILQQAMFYPVHNDLTGDYSMSGLREKVGDALYPMPLSEDFLKLVEPKNRTRLLDDWVKNFRN